MRWCVSAVLAIVALGVAAEPSATWNAGPTASQSMSASTTLKKPLYPGNHQPLPTGPHPSFPWPPKPRHPNPGCQKVQHDFLPGTNADPTRANAVRDLYQRSWAQYAKTCFGNSTMLVVSDSCFNDLFGWGATIVDGIGTAIIMNLTDIVTRQLEFIAQVDFTTTPDLVLGFDAVIRYVAGLLSAYDLLTSGYVPKGTYDQSHIDALLKQATTLGNKLKPQFDNPSGMPALYVNFTTNTLVNSQFLNPLDNVTYNATNTAISGTIILEFHRLSDVTGDESFRELADRTESYLINPNPAPVYPGLVGSELDVETGNYLTFDFGWKSGIDSFLEYLIKTYYYNPADQTAEAYKDFWATAAHSTLQHIALHPYHRPDLTFISEGDVAGNLAWQMDDYACFAGGNLLYGGTLLNEPDIQALGLAVAYSCHHLYTDTKTGLGPLSWAWYNASNQAYDPSNNANPTYRQQAAKDGYFTTNAQYASFPETIESIFYAWRITGDPVWQDYNWGIFQALERESSATVPYASISDVNQPGSFVDYLPSYYWAEVLKYLYLSFVSPDVVSLDEYVFNTESHPFRRNAGCSV